MRTILKIEGVEEFHKNTEVHYRTYAILDDGTECVGYGPEFEEGDLVEVWFEEKYNAIKMRKRPLDRW
jgi:hypothetical protein